MYTCIRHLGEDRCVEGVCKDSVWSLEGVCRVSVWRGCVWRVCGGGV